MPANRDDGSAPGRTDDAASVVARVTNGPAAKATRYVGSGGVVANVTVVPALDSALDATGMFPSATAPFGTVTVRSKGTLNDGSSKQGKARRA